MNETKKFLFEYYEKGIKKIHLTSDFMSKKVALNAQNISKFKEKKVLSIYMNIYNFNFIIQYNVRHSIIPFNRITNRVFSLKVYRNELTKFIL